MYTYSDYKMLELIVECRGIIWLTDGGLETLFSSSCCEHSCTGGLKNAKYEYPISSVYQVQT